MNRHLALFAVVGVLVMGCGVNDPGDTTDTTDDEAAIGTTQQELVVQPGADLRFTSFTQTARTNVDGFQQFSLTVRNHGTADANPSTLVINLLKTQTSPQTFLLGSLQAVPTGCTLSGRTLTCALGRLRYNGSNSSRERTITFGYKIPVTTQALVLNASVSGSGEPAANTTDNAAALTAAVDYRAVAVTSGVKMPSHCSGTALSAYFECTKFPSSITSHSAEYHSDGSITFPDEGGYSGTWTQPDPTRLHFEYSNGVYTAAIFDGRGADGSCFEGITRFFSDHDNDTNTPPIESTFSSPYRVCF